MNNSYNPGWKSDQELIDGFIARHDLFDFLRDELARAPLHGNVQHYLLVGMRGAGKTTMLQRLAVAMRQDADLSDHLIPLSFPEELYQVKNLADFWWAACEALYDALDGTSRHAAARELDKRIDSRPDDSQQPTNDSGLVLLQQTCATIGRRPVLLVDNLDLVLQRIDKKGRKLHDPQAPAYWSLREALSTLDAPIVIGGSVRLTDSFVEYDNVFYDFFVPKRLGKLSLAEVEAILAHLASNNDAAGLKERLDARPGRVQAIYEMTGGNPRAISLIVDLFRKGIDSRAVDDFARLMDLSTPYYKARFEDLSEQAQVVLHALALAKKPETKGNGFGYTAAAVAKQAGLETRIVSAQMDVLVDEGVVEKIGGKGRTQYRVAEQLFRLWMQMRSTRRIRANVQGLVEFLEEMFDEEELRNLPPDAAGAKPLNLATWAFARSEMSNDHAQRYGLKAHATHQLLRHTADTDEQLSDFIGPDDLPASIALASTCRDRLQRCKTWRAKLDSDDQAAILKLPGSLKLNQQQKEAAIDLVCAPESTTEELKELVSQIALERVPLEKADLSSTDIDLLYAQRAQGNLSLPDLTPSDLESVVGVDAALRSLAWKLLVARMISVQAPETASAWIDWALIHATNATAREWRSVANHIGKASHYGIAATAYQKAIALDPENPLSWYNLAVMLVKLQRLDESVVAYRKALEFDPGNANAWNNLAISLVELKRIDEGETAIRKALDVEPTHAGAWNNLGKILSELHRQDEAEAAFRHEIEHNPESSEAWSNLAILLDHMKRYDEAMSICEKMLSLAPSMPATWQNRGNTLIGLKRFDEAEAAFRKALELDPSDVGTWNNLGISLAYLDKDTEAETVFGEVIKLAPFSATGWNNLGITLDNMKRYKEAEAAYRRALERDSKNADWNRLGRALSNQHRHDEAETAFHEAIKRAPSDATGWNNLAGALRSMQRDDEAEAAYIRAAELEPENDIRHIRLGDFRNQRALQTAASAVQARDWAALREHLLPLMEETRRPARWQVSKAFIEDLVAPALQRGDGLPLLTLLREIGLDKTALPLMLALEAAIGNDPERLSDVEPEVRTAALKMFERLGTPASES